MHILTKSEDPDEILLFVEVYTDPPIYTMDHPKFIVSNQKEKSICVCRKNPFLYMGLRSVNIEINKGNLTIS